MERIWDFEDPTFDTWLAVQANAANKDIGKATTNAPVWDTPSTSHRYDTDHQLNTVFTNIWETARDSPLFSQVVPRFLSSAVDDEMSFPGHFANFRKSRSVSALPYSERLRKHNTTVTYIVYLVQSVILGCPMPRRLISHPEHRKLVVLRDLVAVPNQLSPMLTYPAGHDKLSRYVLYPDGVALQDNGLRNARPNNTDIPLDTIQVAPVRRGTQADTGLFTRKEESPSQLNTPSADKNDDTTDLQPVESSMSASSLPIAPTLPKRKNSSRGRPRLIKARRGGLRLGGFRPVNTLHVNRLQEEPSAQGRAGSSSAQPASSVQLASTSSAKEPPEDATIRSASLQPESSAIDVALAQVRANALKDRTSKSAAPEIIGLSPLEQVSSAQPTEPAAAKAKARRPRLLDMVRTEPDQAQSNLVGMKPYQAHTGLGHMGPSQAQNNSVRMEPEQAKLVVDIMVQVAAVGLGARMESEMKSLQLPAHLQQGQSISEADLILAMGRELQDTLPSALEAYQTAILESRPWEGCRENLRRVLVQALRKVQQSAVASQSSSLLAPGQELQPKVPIPTKIATMDDLRRVLDPHLGKMHDSITTIQEAQKAADEASAAQGNRIETLQMSLNGTGRMLNDQIVKHNQLVGLLNFVSQRMDGADQAILRHDTGLRNISLQNNQFFNREAGLVHNVQRHEGICNTLDGKIKGQEETSKAQDDKIKSQDARVKALEERLAAQDQKIAEMMRMLERRV